MPPPQVPPTSEGSPRTDLPSKTRGPRIGVVVGAIVVLAVLAGGAFVLLRGSSSPVASEISKMLGDSEGLRTKATGDIGVLSGDLQNFRIDNDRYPTAAEGLEALRTQPKGAANWRGPYMKVEIPKDPWGNPYVYQWPGPLGDDSFSLLSYGSDDAPGGTGDAEDLVAGER